MNNKKKLNRKCKIENCDLEYYAKGLCHKHYNHSVYRLKHKYKYKKCYFKNCNIKTSKKYCYIHNKRIKKNLPLDLSINCKEGKYNNNWRGGNARYKNERLFYKKRKIKLKLNPICEECKLNSSYFVIHKKDEFNHNIDNLLALCLICCRKKYTLFRKNSNKFLNNFKNVCGKELEEIYKEYGELNKLISYYRKKYKLSTDDDNKEKLLYIYIRKHGLPEKN